MTIERYSFEEQDAGVLMRAYGIEFDPDNEGCMTVDVCTDCEAPCGDYLMELVGDSGLDPYGEAYKCDSCGIWSDEEELSF